MARTILTDEQVKLAIAAGADATTLIAENAEAKKLEGAILEPKEVAAAVANTPDDPAKIEVAAEAIVLATSTAPLSTSVEVDFLKAQLNVANQEIMNLRVSAQSAENKAKSDADAVTSLRKIAADSINNMNVSLRGSATAMDDLTAEQIVTSHKATLTRFLAEFKIGGVAASTSDENTLVKTKTAVSSLDQARVKAAKFGGNK